MDRVKNEEMLWRAVTEIEIFCRRADQRVLRFLGHVARMDEYRMARRVLMADISRGRIRGRPRLDWMDGLRWPWATRNGGGGCATKRER